MRYYQIALLALGLLALAFLLFAPGRATSHSDLDHAHERRSYGQEVILGADQIASQLEPRLEESTRTPSSRSALMEKKDIPSGVFVVEVAVRTPSMDASPISLVYGFDRLGKEEVIGTTILRANQPPEAIVVPIKLADEYYFSIQAARFVPQTLRLSPPPPNEIRALVFDLFTGNEVWFQARTEDDTPIEGATICLTWGEDSTLTRVSTSSNADGFAQVTHCPSGLIWAQASKEGFCTRTIGPISVPDTDPRAWPIVLSRGTSISGRCMHDQEPVDNFRIVYWPLDAIQEHQSQTFEDAEGGRFDLIDVPIGSIQLLGFSRDLMPSRTVTVDTSGTNKGILVVNLSQPRVGQGRVIDHDTLLPLESATVQAYSTSGYQMLYPWGVPAETDTDGRFVIEGLQPDTTVVQVKADGYSAVSHVAKSSASGVLDLGIIYMGRERDLVVRLVSTAPSMDYTPYWIDGRDKVSFPATHFDDAGLIRFRHVRPGDHQLWLNYPDNSYAAFTLTQSETKDAYIEFSVNGQRHLFVRLLRAEDTAPGSMVAATYFKDDLQIDWYKTLSDNQAVFDGMPDTEVSVRLFDSNFKETGLVTGSFEGRTSLSIGIEPVESSSWIRVVDPDMSPVPAAIASVSSLQHNTATLTVVADADGVCSFAALPSGDLLLQVSHAEHGEVPGIPFTPGGSEDNPIVIILNADAHVDVCFLDGDLTLEGLQGRIRDPRFRLPDAAPSLTSDEVGRIHWDRIGAGSYEILSAHPLYWPTTTIVQTNRLTNIQVRRRGSLRILAMSAGVPLVGLPISLVSSEFSTSVLQWLEERTISSTSSNLHTLQDGSLEIYGLPHGSYEWFVEYDGESHSGFTTVPPGENGFLRIDLR